MAKKRSDAERRARQCERLSRLLRTLQLIMSKGRWDADALASELECSRRTVHRVMQTLSMAGVPWYFDSELRAYKVREGYRFVPIDSDNSGQVAEVRLHSKNLGPLIKKLRRDSEAFQLSLQNFLAALRQLEQ